jgi:hypothetical protein
MASILEVAPLITQDDSKTVSMTELAERTVSGSLPMYTLIMLYQNAPYVVLSVFLLGLIIVVLAYYSTKSSKSSGGRKDYESI